MLTKTGKKTVVFQAYRCENGHFFSGAGNRKGVLYTDSFIELIVLLYLKGLSLNSTIEVVRAIYEEEILTKSQILNFIETVADALPTLDDIDRLFQPQRSGYLAFDGVWFSISQQEVVLLVCFDPVSFDIIEALWSNEETERDYLRLITKVKSKTDIATIKGIYGDGDRGLLGALKVLPNIPFQLCIVHKELKMGEVVPVKMVNRSRKMASIVKEEIKEFQRLFRSVIYATTKEESCQALEGLGKFVAGSSSERLHKAYRSLKTNFQLTLTHFDHPGMDRDNNLLECFNGCLKPRLKLMRGFKKLDNLERYLKLFLLAFRFHPLKESSFGERRNRTPLELGSVSLPKYYNFRHWYSHSVL